MNKTIKIKGGKMKTKTKQLLIGILIIIVGIVEIYFNLKSNKAEFNKLWPSILLLIGLFFYIFYFSTKRKKEKTFFLFISSFLAISAIPLFVLTFTSFDNINIVWPGFLLSFGFALLAVYFFGKKKKITLIISSIAISASLLVWIFYMANSPFGVVVAVGLLVIGAAFLTRGLLHDISEVSTAPTGQVVDSTKESGEKNNSADNKDN